MPLLPRLAAAAALSLAALPAAAQAPATPPETIVILDMSGSMWGRIGDATKLEIARGAVREMFTRFPAGSRVGLMAYGHRRTGDCADIETLIPPGPVDAARIEQTLGRLTARGRTPLTDSVRQAAQTLRIAERGGTVILVTDGIETCGADPCALAAELEAANARFTAHVVGFDIRSPAERARLACIADRTGGMFVSAGNAAELATALARTAEAQPAPPPAAPPRLTGLAATLGAGGPRVTDATFTVLLEGEETPLHDGPATGLALRPGRYVVTGSTAERIGSVTIEVGDRAPDEVVVPLADALPRATVTPERTTAVATELLGIAWEGPNEPGDYLVFAPIGAGAEEPETRHYAWTRDGTPARLRVPGIPGAYEVRYMLARAGRPIGRAAVTVTPATVTLAAAPEAVAGSPLEIRWTGPRAPGSWLGIVPRGTAAADYLAGGWQGAEDAESPLTLTAPAAPGEYEIRFVEGADGTVLASIPLRVTEARATLDAPAEAMAGSMVTVGYAPTTAPPGSFVAIVRQGAEDSAYVSGAWAEIEADGRTTLRAPGTAGAHEVRYVLVAPGGAQVLLRRPLVLAEATATLTAPDAAARGERITVRVTGPRGDGDFVTLVPASAADGDYADYLTIGDATEWETTVPDAAGAYELRYVLRSDREGGQVIARRPLTVR
jgi:Ca-activated chloride channel family protein